jgi:hypothetical protein
MNDRSPHGWLWRERMSRLHSNLLGHQNSHLRQSIQFFLHQPGIASNGLRDINWLGLQKWIFSKNHQCRPTR